MYSITEELVHLVERQFRFLELQQESMFVRELRRTLEVLRRDPRLAAILEDERREACELLSAFEMHCTSALERLVELRNQFVSIAPAHDDATAQPLGNDKPGDSWYRSLAWFDSMAAKGFDLGRGGLEDKGSVVQLVKILKRKIQFARPELPDGEPSSVAAMQSSLDELEMKVSEIEREQSDAWRDFSDDALTSPGVALIYLEYVLQQVRASVFVPVHPLAEYFQRAYDLPSAYSMTKFLYEDSEVLKDQRSTMAHNERSVFIGALNALKMAALRVREGILLRIGTTRSLLATFNRFKVRCEWHDRQRLFALVESYSKQAGFDENFQGCSKPEAVLTDELARYLFDQGLNPLTEVPTGGLRPDVLAPESLYVEAKQYIIDSPKAYLLKGVHQMHEIIGRLRGTPWQVREAFYVVFRRGGPLVEMPDAVPCGDWTLYPRLIDVAPAATSGSKAQRRIEITKEDFKPREEVVAPST